jgi:hypothetical protein
MPDRSQTDEELKDRAIEQALTGISLGRDKPSEG